MIRIDDELSRAKQTLGLADNQFRRLPSGEGQAIIKRAEARFVSSTGRTWWWEDLRLPHDSCHFETGDGWRFLTTIAPMDSEVVWFIAASDEWPVYEAGVATIQSVIGECYGFEFYLISRDYHWLIGENHHDVLFACGEPAVTNLEMFCRSENEV